MKPNIIIALLVGLVIGFAVGKVVSGSSSSSTSPAVAGGGAAGNWSEDAFAVKSDKMPAGTFTGMSREQVWNVMKVMNDNTCDCGCDKGTLANCVLTDPNCPNSPAKLKQAAELARQGKTAADIQASMFGPGAKGAPPRPVRPAEDPSAIYKMPLDNSPVKGKATALVTMVEISDYECPFCRRAHTTVEQLQKDYGDKLRVAMKQNPLPFHARARPAALAAMAAGEQGKYWEMHDKLFTGDLDDNSIEKYAQQIGLNVDKWKKSMADPKLAEMITRDQGEASAVGATGTPAFFINGRKISGAQPIENFKRIIDEELKKAQDMVASGVKPEEVYAKVMEKALTAPAPAPAPAAPPTAAAPPPPGQAKKVDVPDTAPFKGPKFAKVTIVEWSDFQCPFCTRVVPTLKQIEDNYGKDVKIVFRHQPLPFHNNAKIAAMASMAAHEQGKFWPMHDKLFANQQALDRPSLEKYAQELGLDMGKFKAALDTNKFEATVNADAAAGAAVGANGTPTFFINGREFVGAQPYEQFKAVIDDEIQKANKLIAAGTKVEDLYKTITEASAAAPAPEVKISLDTAPTKGPKNAPVTIVAFSDFQCPFCSRAVPTLKQIEEQYKGQVRIAFKHQPLPFHNNARAAAMASMAANEQGKFWEMHDKLFANQQALDRASMEKYAQELGLDMGKFKAALDSNKFDQVISADSAEGSRLGANGTPTFFINGRQLVGAQPFDQFKAIIDDELKKKK